MTSLPVKCALYFGCRRDKGHYLFSEHECIWDCDRVPGFPWSMAHTDGGLLNNGKHKDVYDGKVFWTYAKGPWLAFFWWDNSVDSRGASNSGFYVSGFDVTDLQAAFDYARSVFPDVAARQKHPLVLQP